MQSSNDGKHIVSIIGRTPCRKHKVDVHEPCYAIPMDLGNRMLLGICNERARASGAKGKISASSYKSAKHEMKLKRKP